MSQALQWLPDDAGEELDRAPEWQCEYDISWGLFEPRLPRRADDPKSRFSRLSAQWKNETAHYSMKWQIALHPAYLGIIGMGQDAIAFIMADLEQEPADLWSWALEAISGENPIPQEDRGDLVAEGQHWLRWAKNRGYSSR